MWLAQMFVMNPCVEVPGPLFVVIYSTFRVSAAQRLDRTG